MRVRSATAENEEVVSFPLFAALECELIEQRRFETRAEARMAVLAFIEGGYNPRRRHSRLDYRTPIEYEKLHAEKAA